MGQKTTGREIVEQFSQFIDWNKRELTTFPFFLKMVQKRPCLKILDSAAGDGFDSVMFAKQGYDVTANEIDDDFSQALYENARKHRVTLSLTPGYDWRKFPTLMVSMYDAVLCTGNSLTYMMTHKEREAAVFNLTRAAKQGGMVIIDHRNYDTILKLRDPILEDPEHNFRFSSRFYYCGDSIAAYPVEIGPREIIMEYKRRDTGEVINHLRLYPICREETIELMEAEGLSVTSFGDFHMGKVGGDVDFYQHIGIRR